MIDINNLAKFIFNQKIKKKYKIKTIYYKIEIKNCGNTRKKSKLLNKKILMLNNNYKN